MSVRLFDDVISLLGDEFPIVRIISYCVTIGLIIAVVRYFIKNE